MLLTLAGCSENPADSSGRLAVSPEYQAIVGGRECTVKSINIALGSGMYADLSCPNGEFQTTMECPGFSLNKGQIQCPDKLVHTTLKHDGRTISDKQEVTP